MGNALHGTNIAYYDGKKAFMETIMKKTAIILFLMGFSLYLGAGLRLGYQKLDNTDKDLFFAENQAQALARQDIEVYYFNDNYILAGVPDNTAADSWRWIAPTSANEKLYLISPKQNIKLPPLKIMADMGTELLIASDKSIERLSAELKLPPIPFERRALSFQPQCSPRFSAPQRGVSELTSLVSADSVMAFIQGLQDLQTRYALADNRLHVANWIKAQFERFGVPNVELQSFYWNGTTQYNVVATICGSTYPDEYIVIGGHHDSITYTTPYTLAPGADDNASGATAALEMARVMMASDYHPRRTIRFVTYAAEEFGLWGSKHNASTSAQAAENIRLMINHDMIANNHTGGSNVLLMPYAGSLEQSQAAKSITEANTSLNVVYGSMNSASSDSHSYWIAGYPVVYFFEHDFSPYYHSDNDITAHIDKNYAAEVIRASTAVAYNFANMLASPANFHVQDVGNGSSLHLSWDMVNDPLLDHYRIYYSSVSQAGTHIDTMQNTCQLHNLNLGEVYYFELCSVDAQGNESYRVYATGSPLSNPRPVEGFADEPQNTGILLSWQPNSELDLAGYRIYKSQDPDQQGTMVGTGFIIGTEYFDADVVGSLDFYYYYRIAAVDNEGNESVLSQALKSRPATLDQGILIIDDSPNYSGANPSQPSDAMVDDFFSGIMDNFQIHHLDLAQEGAQLRLADIGIYSAILWHSMGTSDSNKLYQVRGELDKYLQLNGNIFYTGFRPTLAYEIATGYPASFLDTDFPCYFAGIGGADYSVQARFKYSTPRNGYEQFPELVIDPAKTTPPLNGHTFGMEGMTAGIGGMDVYGYGSDYPNDSAQGALNGQSVAILKINGAGRIFSTSIPLYYLEEAGARTLVNLIFRYYFNQPSATDDPAIPAANLGVNAYPNPFNNAIQLQIKGSKANSLMQADIYNLKGQKVRHLYSGKGTDSLAWDAKDDNGKPVASGIYFVRLQQDGRKLSKKLLKM